MLYIVEEVRMIVARLLTSEIECKIIICSSEGNISRLAREVAIADTVDVEFSNRTLGCNFFKVW